MKPFMTSNETSSPRAKLMLCGAGSLGKSFLRLLRDLQDEFNLMAVVTAHHGQLVDAEGIDPSVALNLIEAEGFDTSNTSSIEEIIEAVKPDILVECIPQNMRSGDPALGILKTALDQGIHVVTANKSAIALGYRDLLHRSAKSNVTIGFEATVLDGVPIFSFVEQMKNTSVVAVRGVVNGTSSLVLESLQYDSTRSRGLARAQALGIAEADTVLDLDGWDASAKAALLANVWMNGSLRVFDVVRSGCESLKDADVKAAAEQGRYRLVIEVSKTESGQARATVTPTLLEPGDALYSLTGASGGLQITTDSGQKMVILHNSPGLESAALGLLHDCRRANQAIS
ncbi:MAG: hypothetical protein VYC39_17500 [Myxococcota bacterium]|nr:hypothetical protein [Myxococcota bacterium]